MKFSSFMWMIVVSTFHSWKCNPNRLPRLHTPQGPTRSLDCLIDSTGHPERWWQERRILYFLKTNNAHWGVHVCTGWKTECASVSIASFIKGKSNASMHIGLQVVMIHFDFLKSKSKTNIWSKCSFCLIVYT